MSITDTPVISLRRDYTSDLMTVVVERLGLQLRGTLLHVKQHPDLSVVLSAGREARLVWALLLRNGELGLQELVELVWEDPDLQPDFAISEIRSITSRLRPKLADLGFNVMTRWGWGYSLVQAAVGGEAHV